MQSEIDDLSAVSAPVTDQLNADDLIGGPRIFTITRITKGKMGGRTPKKGEQPVNIHLAEHPHPWRPCTTVRRLLVDAWGPNPAGWPDGARVELYREPEVRSPESGEMVGGVRVCGLSHLERSTLEHVATVSRGKRVRWTVRRLDNVKPTTKPEAPPTADNITAAVHYFEDTHNVTRAQLEKLLDAPTDAWTRADLLRLRGISDAIKSGEKTVADVFGGQADPF